MLTFHRLCPLGPVAGFCLFPFSARMDRPAYSVLVNPTPLQVSFQSILQAVLCSSSFPLTTATGLLLQHNYANEINKSNYIANFQENFPFRENSPWWYFCSLSGTWCKLHMLYYICLRKLDRALWSKIREYYDTE